MVTSTEAVMEWGDYAAWYRVTGDLAAATPLVILHGGPGMAHDYLDSLTRLADSGRAVIHYDQVGCGKSSHHPDADPSMWTVELFVEELTRLLATLGIDQSGYHLLGQSWGGMLAAEFAVLQPLGLRSLILSNSPASIPTWTAEARRLRLDLPEGVRDTLDRHEAAGTIDDPESWPQPRSSTTATSAEWCRIPKRCSAPPSSSPRIQPSTRP
jgi:L-proline amide hydrolase